MSACYCCTCCLVCCKNVLKKPNPGSFWVLLWFGFWCFWGFLKVRPVFVKRPKLMGFQLVNSCLLFVE